MSSWGRKGPFLVVLGVFWGHFWSSWGSFSISWGGLGALLGGLGGSSGSWAAPGASSAAPGVDFGVQDSSWRPLWAVPKACSIQNSEIVQDIVKTMPFMLFWSSQAAWRKAQNGSETAPGRLVEPRSCLGRQVDVHKAQVEVHKAQVEAHKAQVKCIRPR